MPSLVIPGGSIGPRVASFLRRLLPLLPSELTPHAVGGFLRDALLGRSTLDLDVTINGDALAVARRLADALDGAFVPLDEPRQITRVVLHHSGQAWKVDLASRHGSLLEDLGRRDFTVDAMSVPLDALLAEDWREAILDPFGGRADLDRRLIRAVRPEVFQDDGLRLLRAVRLAAYLSFDIEPGTRDLIRRDVSALAGVSGERVRDELLAILASRQAVRHVYLLDDLGLLAQVVPEMEQGRGVTQPKEHYWDVFHHNVETVGAVEGLLERIWEPSWPLDSVPWTPDLQDYFQQVVGEGHTRATLLKLAGLLHDIAKPATRTIDPTGRIRFRGHHSQGAEMASVILRRLRLGRRSAKMIELQVEHHLRPGQMSHGNDMPTPHAVYRFFRSAGDAAVDTLYLNLADYLAARGPLLEQDEWVAYAGKVRHILEAGLVQAQTPETPKLLDGHELMATLGLASGPVVGRLLEAIHEAHATGEIATRDQALDMARSILARGSRKERNE
ncbi:MAG: HD domain-containing protein [Chloroflexi bacterium]|nr:HD domain-containing protein [Chloroflexota bacterium]